LRSLTEITIGQYVPGDSFVHRLDARTKLITTLMLITVLFLVNTFMGYALTGLLVFVSIGVSRLPVRFVIRGIRPLVIIILLTLALQLFMTPGEVIISLGPLDITREGLTRGAMIGARLILLIMGTSVLTLTTSPIELTDGIEKLLGPGKRVGVPAHELAMMMTIALRFIPTLLQEADRIMKAQMARGADFESGHLVQRARNLVPLLVPLFISAFRRADDLAEAMEARCYRGGEGRTKLRQSILRAGDYSVLVGIGIFVTGVGAYL